MRTRDFKVGANVQMHKVFRERTVIPFLAHATGTIESIIDPMESVAIVRWDERCRSHDDDPITTTVHRTNLELIKNGGE